MLLNSTKIKIVLIMIKIYTAFLVSGLNSLLINEFSINTTFMLRLFFIHIFLGSNNINKKIEYQFEVRIFGREGSKIENKLVKIFFKI